MPQKNPQEENESVSRAAVKATPVPIEQNAQQAPSWKPFLDLYLPSDQVELAFESRSDAKRAIDLLWTDTLHDCPHYLTPDGVIVPATAVQYFRRAGLIFSEYQTKS